MQSQLNEFEKVIKDSSKALINLEKNQIKLKDEYSSVEEKFIKSNQYLSSVEKEKNDFQNKIQDIRIELINIENNKDNIEFKIRVSEETIKEIELRNEEIKKELSETNMSPIPSFINIKNLLLSIIQAIHYFFQRTIELHFCKTEHYHDQH